MGSGCRAGSRLSHFLFPGLACKACDMIMQAWVIISWVIYLVGSCCRNGSHHSPAGVQTSFPILRSWRLPCPSPCQETQKFLMRRKKRRRKRRRRTLIRRIPTRRTLRSPSPTANRYSFTLAPGAVAYSGNPPRQYVSHSACAAVQFHAHCKRALQPPPPPPPLPLSWSGSEGLLHLAGQGEVVNGPAKPMQRSPTRVERSSGESKLREEQAYAAQAWKSAIDPISQYLWQNPCPRKQ